MMQRSSSNFFLIAALSAAVAIANAQSLESPRPQTNMTWTYDQITTSNWHGELSVKLTKIPAGSTVYLRRGARPTLTQFDHVFTKVKEGSTIRVTNKSVPALQTSTYHIGVYHSRVTPAKFTKQVSIVKSEFDGKGAIPFTGGTTFRIWAPNASGANVAGQFNNWSTTQATMVSEPGGWWSLDLRNALAGQQYKFVLKNGTNTLWRNDPWARSLTNSVGNSVIVDHKAFVWTNNNFATPSWNDAVIYQMHIGTYNDTPGGVPGTFSSAILKLDHLQDLGVNVIKLLPVQEFPGDYSWGYNPSHQFAVESAYGGPANLKRFVNEANARGIAVLLDVVHNHYGPSDLGIWQFDGWSQNGRGGIFFYNDDRAITPWGDTRPDFGRGEVRQFIRDNQMEWANEYRVSGFRWDSTLNIRRTNWGDNPDGWSLLQYLNNELKASQPWKINIAEDLQNDSWITRPTSQGGAGFDAQWSNYVHNIRSQITGGDDNARSMSNVRAQLLENFNGNPMQRVIYTESHDENANGKQRVTSTIDPADPDSLWAQKRSTLGAAITLTAPGMPMIFQGQEFLEDGWFADTDPIDWTKNTTYAGIKALYRDLIRLRRNLNGSSNGLRGNNINVHHMNESNKVIAYHRWMNGGTNDDVVVIANFRNTTYNNYRIGLPRAGGWNVLFNSDWNGYSSLFGNISNFNLNTTAPAQDGMAQSGTVNLAPYSVVILGKS
jgi:1,4-alpha-glucan branching enzyme